MNLHQNILRFIKDWMLIISILLGVTLYLVYHHFTPLHVAGPYLLRSVQIIQPTLLFSMLFLSFSKISIKDMHLQRWHYTLLIIQLLPFIALTLLLSWALSHDSPFALWLISKRIPIEAFMLCMITPTATAAAVVTNKLGGNMASVVTYTILINLAAAITIPLTLPMLYPTGGITFTSAFLTILYKVFPLLIFPALLAWLVRHSMPLFHQWLTHRTNWAFYLWAVGLTLAILMSTRAIIHNEGSSLVLIEIAISSLVACILQFALGKLCGIPYSSSITSGQALGQKNTVLTIWIGYTFMNPIISVAGGFYSIWHNCYNSYQLYQQRKNNS